MRCFRARRWIAAAATGGGSWGRGRAALDRHLVACDACRTIEETNRRLDGLLAALPTAATVPASLEAATLRRVRELAAAEAERSGDAGGWWRWVGVAALPAVAAAAVLLVAVRGVYDAGVGSHRTGAGVGSDRTGAEAPPARSAASGQAAASAARGGGAEPTRVAAGGAPGRDAVAPTAAEGDAAPAEPAARPRRLERDDAAPTVDAPAASALARSDVGADGAPDLPPELAARPDLFVDMPILKNMEKLQNFDAIRTVDGPTEAPANG